MALLETRDMSVTFGGLRAVNEVNFTVEQGQLVGLIGPNGAGKTTFIDGITGFVRTTGRIELDGREISGLPANKRAALGLGRTWQSLELFDDLTVAENLQVAAERQSPGSFLADLVHPRRSRDESDDERLHAGSLGSGRGRGAAGRIRRAASGDARLPRSPRLAPSASADGVRRGSRATRGSAS